MSRGDICGVVGLLGLVVVSCAAGAEQAPVPANAKTLGNDEVRQALVGKRIYSHLKNGVPYSMSFNADGTEVYRESGQPPATEKWTLKDGVVCIYAKDWPVECSNVKAAQGDLWFVNPEDGSIRYHYTYAG